VLVKRERLPYFDIDLILIGCSHDNRSTKDL
jgi:hypothetical protein